AVLVGPDVGGRRGCCPHTCPCLGACARGHHAAWRRLVRSNECANSAAMSNVTSAIIQQRHESGHGGSGKVARPICPPEPRDCVYISQTGFLRVGHPPKVRCAQNHSLWRQYFSTRAEPSLRSPWLQATSRRHSSTASPSPLPHSVALNSK